MREPVHTLQAQLQIDGVMPLKERTSSMTFRVQVLMVSVSGEGLPRNWMILLGHIRLQYIGEGPLEVAGVIDAFVGRTYQRRPKAAQAGDMDSNTI
jgi:hypothetical protein